MRPLTILPQSSYLGDSSFSIYDTSRFKEVANMPYSITPVLLDSTKQVLLVTCISIRDNIDYCILPAHERNCLRIYPTLGSTLKKSMSADNLDSLTIHLSANESFRNHYDLLIGTGAERTGSEETIRVPLHLGGCRFSYFPVRVFDATICLVHQLIDVNDDTDLFIEEQEFMFTAMSIQENLFLTNQSIPVPIHYVESKVVLSSSLIQDTSNVSLPEDASSFQHKAGNYSRIEASTTLDDEIELMNSLIKRYGNSKLMDNSSILTSNALFN